MPEKRVILIAGPTASGKSTAALALAEKIGGEIVNADALQVYRDLRILSARPSPAEEARAPHHLYGSIDGAVRYSAGEWSRAAARVIPEIHARGRAAIIVGGTGLYFRALEGGLCAAPAIPQAIRAAAAARLEAIGTAAFRAEVLSFDPAMAGLDPDDRQRHVRAWEVYHAAGAPLSEIRKRQGAAVIDEASARLVIEPPREALYAAIERRYDAMISRGALDEARALAARGLDPGLPVMKAVGAAELFSHLAGEISHDEAIRLAKRNSRRLAKRQLTWFRGQTPDWPRAGSAEAALDHVLSALVASNGPGG
ncbi:MAG: tRNA (adenosine(37)-N6)-dimethylallyltransferase MiaA [Parvularculaceae bacterium]|nr:tRNA (adenosine(37)-N6)-dimethylallyltransferase MiaA [Parvularculaceae bacterium]